VYCSDTPVALDTELTSASYDPGGFALRVLPGVDRHGTRSDRCIALEPEQDLAPDLKLAPPLDVGGVALDPEPLTSVALSPVVPLECSKEETKFGPGCAEIQDDRVIVRSSDRTLFWSIFGSGVEQVEVTGPSARFALGGLVP